MASLNLLVIRAADLKASVLFYENLLGEKFAPEKHGEPSWRIPMGTVLSDWNHALAARSNCPIKK